MGVLDKLLDVVKLNDDYDDEDFLDDDILDTKMIFWMMTMKRNQ